VVGSAPGPPLRVVIADDQALVRTGFRLILEAQPDMLVTAEAANGEEAVAAVRRTRPSLVLMDVRMPVLDGLAAARRILDGREAGRPWVIMLTTFDLDEYVYAAMAAGASGFLLKDITGEQLVAAVRLVAAGEALLAPSVTRRLIERYARGGVASATAQRELSSLTARELEVLRLLGRGLSNAELADRLHLSETTVKSHVVHVFSKLGLRDRAQAVVLAYETGLVQPGG
jgi:DNA-binding NarL/FixJ family response regulator